MKHLLLIAMSLSYSLVSFGYDDPSLDASIEAETAFSSSEEARAEADELKRMAKEEKKRKEVLKEASIKSAKDAKSLELAAVREALDLPSGDGPRRARLPRGAGRATS